MPPLPVVSAILDMENVVKRNGIKEYSSLEGWTGSSWGGNEIDFWTISLQWGERPVGRNYYALEMHEKRTLIEGVPSQWVREGKFNDGIYVSDLSKLQDNPEVEVFEVQEIDLGGGTTINYDTYRFPILLMSDMAFTPDDASLTLLKRTLNNFIGVANRNHIQQNVFPKFHHTITLRVRHITEATFRYYRSLTLQSIGLDFFTEPVNIISNIENGYGCFTVFSAVDFQLLEYESVDYSGNW